MNRIALVLLAAPFALGACKKKGGDAPKVQTVALQRRDIIVDAEATGVVEPINVIEVKSKASGQIERMPVETGSKVKPGDLLVQVDTRDVRGAYDQALADVRAADARVAVSNAQRKRSEDLFQQQIITAQEHEATQLDYANAQAQLARTRAALDLAKQRLEDAIVRAPAAGTVIEKSVSTGQVITSATGAFGGGTLLLKMADLSQVRVRALVNETDIGNVQPGQQATVTVDAYPDRPFRGAVEKIEPQAVVQQNVTMFPVLVSVTNREGLLMPGMNGEVSILIDRRDNVLAVPNEAVRTPRDITTAATALGLNPDTVRKQVQAQFAEMGRMGAMDGAGGNGAPAAGVTNVSRGELASTGDPAQQGSGQRQQAAQPSAEECARVQTALQQKPAVRARLDSVRARMRSGEIDMQQGREASRAAAAELGVDARTMMMCSRQAGDAQRGGTTPSATSRSGTTSAQAPQIRGELPAGDPAGGARTQRARTGLVFVAENATFQPRLVRLGVANYDFTEVLSGLEEGEQVALLAAAALQQRRQEQLDRFRGMTGGGVPGMQRQTTTPGGTGGTGGAGARPGGAPRTP